MLPVDAAAAVGFALLLEHAAASRTTIVTTAIGVRTGLVKQPNVSEL